MIARAAHLNKDKASSNLLTTFRETLTEYSTGAEVEGSL